MSRDWALSIIFGVPIAFTAILLAALIIDISTDGRFITWLFKGRI